MVHSLQKICIKIKLKPDTFVVNWNNVWSPLKKDIEILEKKHIRTTRMVPEMRILKIDIGANFDITLLFVV